MSDPARRDRFFAGAAIALFDEAHEALGPETRKVVDACPARVKIAWTATPPVDERRELFDAYFGPVIFQVTTPSMVAKGRLSRPTYHQIATDFQWDGDRSDFSAILDAALACPARNGLVLRTIVGRCGPHRLGLALTARVDNAKMLAAGAREVGLRAAHLTGDVKAAERERILGAARGGDLDLLTATTVGDTGLDVPRIADVYLCAPGREGGRFLQRIGRGMRLHESKTASTVFDFVDRDVSLLAYQAHRRARAFANIWRESETA